MSLRIKSVPLICVFALGGCVVLPKGPSQLALPGTGKTFETFQVDDMTCRSYASAQNGGVNASQAASDSVAQSAALGTVIGAVAGAAIGGNRGVGTGAGTGLLLGTMSGASAGQASARGTQRSYDHAYIQCMYAKGHRVPIVGDLRARSTNMLAPAGTYSQPIPMVAPTTAPMRMPPPPPPGIGSPPLPPTGNPPPPPPPGSAPQQ